MKNEMDILRTWKPPRSPEPDTLAEGTQPNIEREQFAQLIDLPMVEVMNLLEDCYYPCEHKVVLAFLECFAGQEGHLEIIVTSEHGAVLALVS